MEEFISSVVSASEQGKRYFPDTAGGDDLSVRLKQLQELAAAETQQLVAACGGGSCYVYDSLPFSYAYFLKNPFSSEALIEVVNAGGDTDSNGAMVGALLGALHGTDIFPQHLIDGLKGKEQIIDAVDRFCERFGITK